MSIHGHPLILAEGTKLMELVCELSLISTSATLKKPEKDKSTLDSALQQTIRAGLTLQFVPVTTPPLSMTVQINLQIGPMK